MEDHVIERGRFLDPQWEEEAGVLQLRQVEDITRVRAIAEDCEGGDYYRSMDSGLFYKLQRSEFAEQLAVTNPFFPDWLIKQYPEQPEGRPWATYLIPGEENPWSKPYAHATIYPLERIAERLLSIAHFSLVFSNATTFSALCPEKPVLFEAFQKYRGFRTHLELSISYACRTDQDLMEAARGFDAWLKAEGFVHPDHPSVRGLDENDYGVLLG